MYSVVLPSKGDLQHLHILKEELQQQRCFHEYAEIITGPQHGCWTLFGKSWPDVYRLQVNKEFREVCPNPPGRIPRSIRIYSFPEFVRDQNAITRMVKKRIPKCPIVFQDRQAYSGSREVIEFKNDSNCLRHQAFLSIKDRYSIPLHEQIYGKLQEVDWTTDFIFTTRTEQTDPDICSNWDDLLLDILYNNKGCYWISLEPFKLFFDVDFYHADKLQAMTWREITIEQIIEAVSRICNYWLVTETVLSDGRPLHYADDIRLRFRNASYNIFTDRLVYMREAIEIEQQLSRRFPGIVGTICDYWQPFVYRRAPFAKQKWWPHENNPLRKKSEPRLHLSHLPMVNPCKLDILKFSYPNQ